MKQSKVLKKFLRNENREVEMQIEFQEPLFSAIFAGFERVFGKSSFLDTKLKRVTSRPKFANESKQGFSLQ